MDARMDPAASDSTAYGRSQHSITVTATRHRAALRAAVSLAWPHLSRAARTRLY